MTPPPGPGRQDPGVDSHVSGAAAAQRLKAPPRPPRGMGKNAIRRRAGYHPSTHGERPGNLDAIFGRPVRLHQVVTLWKSNVMTTTVMVSDKNGRRAMYATKDFVDIAPAIRRGVTTPALPVAGRFGLGQRGAEFVEDYTAFDGGVE